MKPFKRVCPGYEDEVYDPVALAARVRSTFRQVIRDSKRIPEEDAAWCRREFRERVKWVHPDSHHEIEFWLERADAILRLMKTPEFKYCVRSFVRFL